MALLSRPIPSIHKNTKPYAKKGDAGYGGVRFRDTKGEKSGRSPRWSDAGIPKDTKRPQTGPQTSEEVLAYRNKSGIAPTAKNMGDLSVQYRADEATALKAGELTDRNKRDQKILDKRDGSEFIGNTPMDSFKKQYWKARGVWAEDKNAYTGRGRQSGEQQRTPPGQLETPATRQLTSKRPSSGRRKYGLF